MSKANEPAFPMVTEERDKMGGSLPGITKREYFAALAMQGFLSKCAVDHDQTEPSECDKGIARNAAFMADALIAELEKQP